MSPSDAPGPRRPGACLSVALLGMFLSFVCGVAWGAMFLAVKSALPGVPLELVMGLGVAFVIFLVLAVHRSHSAAPRSAWSPPCCSASWRRCS
ncbi:hypothetical protein [Rhodococcus aetherivorans]|uniref:hypothetical protein n=1 Tax=Rhodococcus aetherivorans TaxID=191292 RepID=UPI0036509FDB